uniref:Single Ig and TIR domain containing n=1 Tax=Taeniopygia guttata TaxID=59729 RepID=A0A674H1N8_TAEGU
MGSGWAVGAARTLSGKEPDLGTAVHLLLVGVTAWPDPQHPPCPVRSGQNSSEQLLASVLQLNLTHDADFGVFACWISNATATFTLRQAEAVGHVPAVLAALLVLVLLVLLAVLYVQCRLNVLLWYRDRYGELEINDGKLYDAYVSHATAPDDRKFIHFIVKPQLENRHGYKLFLDEQNILPNSEPSADLIMNVSRCRRLIVVLSVAYLEQEWCNSSFREGLWRLLELSRKPIFIVFESQYREITHPAITLLKQHRSTVTLLVWRAGSMVSAEQDLTPPEPLSLPSTPQCQPPCCPLGLPHSESCAGPIPPAPPSIPSSPFWVNLPAALWGCAPGCSAKEQVGALTFWRTFKNPTRRAPHLGAHSPNLHGQDPMTLQGLPGLSSPSGALAQGHSGHFGARLGAGALGSVPAGRAGFSAGAWARCHAGAQPSPWPSSQRRGERAELLEPCGAVLRWSRPGSSPPGSCRPHRRTSGRSCAWPCRARCPSRAAWGTRRPSCRRTRTPC